MVQFMVATSPTTNAKTATTTTAKSESKEPKKKKNYSKNKKNNNKWKNASKPNLSKKQNQSSTKLAPLSDLKLGSKIDGHVAAFSSFGIFIKTKFDFKNRGSNGYALLHKSQIRDEPVEDMSKLFRIGAKVKGLRVININYAQGEVGVSLRGKRKGRKSMREVPIGKEMIGTVSQVVAYGAFVDVGADVNALVHISRISQKKIKNIRHFVNDGDKVTIRVISKDEGKKTMAASMLGKDADEYLDGRSAHMKKMRESVAVDNLKSELEYFEDAVQELEAALSD